jgi:hypothetical protein
MAAFDGRRDLIGGIRASVVGDMSKSAGAVRCLADGERIAEHAEP